MVIILLVLLLVGSVWLTDLLAYLPLSLLYALHLPRWIGWVILVAIAAGLLGDGPPGPLPPRRQLK